MPGNTNTTTTPVNIAAKIKLCSITDDAMNTVARSMSLLQNIEFVHEAALSEPVRSIKTTVFAPE